MPQPAQKELCKGQPEQEEGSSPDATSFYDYATKCRMHLHSSNQVWLPYPETLTVVGTDMLHHQDIIETLEKSIVALQQQLKLQISELARLKQQSMSSNQVLVLDHNVKSQERRKKDCEGLVEVAQRYHITTLQEVCTRDLERLAEVVQKNSNVALISSDGMDNVVLFRTDRFSAIGRPILNPRFVVQLLREEDTLIHWFVGSLHVEGSTSSPEKKKGKEKGPKGEEDQKEEEKKLSLSTLRANQIKALWTDLVTTMTSHLKGSEEFETVKFLFAGDGNYQHVSYSDDFPLVRDLADISGGTDCLFRTPRTQHSKKYFCNIVFAGRITRRSGPDPFHFESTKGEYDVEGCEWGASDHEPLSWTLCFEPPPLVTSDETKMVVIPLNGPPLQALAKELGLPTNIGGSKRRTYEDMRKDIKAHLKKQGIPFISRSDMIES